MHELLAYIPLVALAGSVLGAIFSLRAALHAIGAKRQVHYELIARATYDRDLERLIARAVAKERLNSADLALATQIIESAAKKRLSAKDQRFVEVGLRQPQTEDKKRFVRDVLTAA